MLSVQREQLQDMDNNRYHPDGFDPRFLDDFNHVSLKFLLEVIFFILGSSVEAGNHLRCSGLGQAQWL